MPYSSTEKLQENGKNVNLYNINFITKLLYKFYITVFYAVSPDEQRKTKTSTTYPSPTVW